MQRMQRPHDQTDHVGRVRLAETCESRDESPSSNLSCVEEEKAVRVDDASSSNAVVQRRQAVTVDAGDQGHTLSGTAGSESGEGELCQVTAQTPTRSALGNVPAFEATFRRRGRTCTARVPNA